MTWFGLPPKPNIPQDERDFLEQAGPETVRILLYNGWSNPAGLTEAQQRSRAASEERDRTVAWLKWRTAKDALWIKVGVVSAVLAAIFSFYSLIK